jgi:dethiobiotin synthetase
MTIECARAAGLEVAGVVLTPWPAQPGAMEHSNRETIARLGDVEVETLPALAVRTIGPQPHLPIVRWLGPGGRAAQPDISVVEQPETLARRAA